jgi:hypothetical protein
MLVTGFKPKANRDYQESGQKVQSTSIFYVEIA